VLTFLLTNDPITRNEKPARTSTSPRTSAEHCSVGSRDASERVALSNEPGAPAVAAIAVDAVDGPVLFLKIPFAPSAVEVWEEEEERKRKGLEVAERLRDESSDDKRREGV
jgi:hypothetical protein